MIMVHIQRPKLKSDSVLSVFILPGLEFWYIIKLKPRSLKSSEHINEKGDGPYRGFGYLSLFIDPTDLTTWSQRESL